MGQGVVSWFSLPSPKALFLDTLLISFVSVALAEIGDKTQLLALILAARFRKPWPILAGILVATLANHAIAAEIGALAASLFTPDLLRWIVALSLIAMGLWILIPDKDEDAAAKYHYGPFLTTLIAFFLLEIGDKTQIATVVLAAKFDNLLMVVLGTTLGMMAANAPAVFIGQMTPDRLPLGLIRLLAAAVFIILGCLALLGDSIPLFQNSIETLSETAE